ncbi:hypothetical protein, partial [Bordetella pseudohinzii]
ASNTNDAPGMCLPPRTNRMAQIYFARRRAKWLTFQLRLTIDLLLFFLNVKILLKNKKLTHSDTTISKSKPRES